LSGGDQDGYSSSVTYTSWHTADLQWTGTTKQLSNQDANPVDFQCTEAIAVGLPVDFVVDPFNGNAYYDATRFVLTIHSAS
jgi:hypothetical protein